MSLVIATRFRGPTTSGNGGYVSGLAAALHGASGPVTVTLRRPPPLERSLPVSRSGDVLRVTDGDVTNADAADGGAVVVEAVAAGAGEDAAVRNAVVDPVDVETARATGAAFPGLVDHPFPECFVCGPARDPGDGLRLFPGRLDDGRTACVWDVAPDLAGRAEFVWAALDCPGGWTAPIEGRPMVLGQMTASVDSDRLPAAGDGCVVMGRLVGSEGRKVWTDSTVYSPSGDVVGRAHATWIVLPN